MKKKLLATFLVLGSLVSVGYYGASGVRADNVVARNILAQRIAEKFNLQEDDVEAVFQAVHDERIADMEKQREDRLNQAVDDGVITEDQKNAILEKMKEQFDQREKNREDMQAWFQDQGIDETKLREYLGFGGHMGGMGHGSMM